MGHREEGKVTDFRTWMTGELYALLRRHSILARMLPDDEPALDEAAFDQGVAHALRTARPVAHRLQHAHAVAVQPHADRSSAQLSVGPGHRRRTAQSQSLPRGEPVVVMGAEALTARYELALRASSACRCSAWAPAPPGAACVPLPIFGLTDGTAFAT
jgi:2-dehydro-3-deoxygalactonokinase